jgi:2-polyprenyl-3-methyl-5-hydroxy-6-metoxy-1,4-benzoquinol methylase
VKTHEAPDLHSQAAYWDEWNRSNREGQINRLSRRQATLIHEWIADLGRTDLSILDVGCGSGWMCEQLLPFGEVTGLDLSPNMLQRAQMRVPEAHFIAGDVLASDLEPASFDVVVTMGVIAHVEDQSEFLRKCAELLKPGGLLLLTVQNRPIYERMAEIEPPSPRQIRRWLDHKELRQLIPDQLIVRDLLSVCPRGYNGFLRYVNSVKLNGIMDALFTEQRIEMWKERLFLGCTLVLRAEKRRPE